MNVLYLLDTLQVGGAEKSMLDILSRFQSIEPILCHLYPGQALKHAYEKAGISVISLDIPGKYSFTKAIHAVRHIIRGIQPALLHSTLYRSDIVARIAGRLEKVPVINSFVNDTYTDIRWHGMTAVQRFKHRCIWGIDRATAHLVTGFAANSQAIKISNCKALGVPLQKVRVIYRGRDLDTFRSGNRGVKSITVASLEMTSKSKIIINVGRLIDRKGQDVLLRSMPQVLGKYPDARLLIAGEGPYRQVLEQLITELHLRDAVYLLGTRHDVPQLLQAADLFVSPSYYEGLPGAVVEAMLAGLPVVLSDMDVHREMVSDGITGCLVPIKNVAALAGSIIELLDNPEQSKSMGARARERACELFDIKEVVAQHEKFYSDVFEEWRLRRH
jgi:glycosyltransferase involved in cell wall biosynthesis